MSTDTSNDVKDYLENIVACMPYNVYWLNEDGELLGGNENLAKMFGLKSRNDLVGLTYSEMANLANWTEGQGDAFRNVELEVMRSGIPKYNIEEPPINVDGATKHYVSSKVPLRNSKNEIMGIVGISVDMTELKETEAELNIAKAKAEQANQAKSAFLATMSHELRTPLNGILGMTQILKSATNSANNEQYISAIEESGKHLLALVNDIIDFSKLEAGKVEIESAPFSLAKLINETIISMRHLVDDKHIEMSFSYGRKIPEIIWGDKLRIRQVLVNLIGNAIKFTQHGHIHVLVRSDDTAKSKAGYCNIKITVEDTGIGIAKDKLEAIFERFTQVESNYNRRFKGAGLGLAISQNLVDLMHGKIGVTSRINKGAKFWFTLACKVADEKALSKQYKTDYSEVSSEPIHANILLVEDNLMNQKVAELILTDVGCTIDIAGTGKEAIRFVKKHKYDLIFMDLSLPDTDGLDVTRELLKIEKGPHTPIIALTAHVLDEDKQNCLNAGMDDVMTKPLIKEEIQHLLQRWIIDAD